MENWLFPQETKSLKGQEVIVDQENLSSDWISYLIKSWRLWDPIKSYALFHYFVNSKILSLSYVIQRALIFAYEDWWIEMIKLVWNAVEHYEKTAMKRNKWDNWKREKIYTWNWDNNIYQNIVIWCAILPKRREYTKWENYNFIHWKWLDYVDDWIILWKKYLKEWIKFPSYVLDSHSKTWKKYEKLWYTLDKRYSWDDFWNKYMELEYQKYWCLNPDNIDIELEKEANILIQKLL